MSSGAVTILVLIFPVLLLASDKAVFAEVRPLFQNTSQHGNMPHVVRFNKKTYKHKFENELLREFNAQAWELLSKRYERKRRIWRHWNLSEKDFQMQEIEDAFREEFKFLFLANYQKIFGDYEVPKGYKNLRDPENKVRLEKLARHCGNRFYHKKNDGWWAWLFYKNVDCRKK